MVFGPGSKDHKSINSLLMDDFLVNRPAQIILIIEVWGNQYGTHTQRMQEYFSGGRLAELASSFKSRKTSKQVCCQSNSSGSIPGKQSLPEGWN